MKRVSSSEGNALVEIFRKKYFAFKSVHCIWKFHLANVKRSNWFYDCFQIFWLNSVISGTKYNFITEK